MKALLVAAVTVDLRRWRQRRALRGTYQGDLLEQVRAGTEAMHELNRRRREGRRR